ncbi:MAG: DUF4240 domain-containing protein [Planctomycetota bacterium]
MNEKTFWKIIDTSLVASEDDVEKQLKNIEEQLLKLPATGISDFDRICTELHNDAYRWDLWAAAYVINGGCSDDGFDYFRAWLISRGREVYEAALDDPDNLADYLEGDDGECELEELLNLAGRVYKVKTGELLPASGVTRPAEPAGESWEEDDAELRRIVPRLWKKFGG